MRLPRAHSRCDTAGRGNPVTAFVLSGGASLAAAQVGMLQALYERGIEPDLLEVLVQDPSTSERKGARRSRGASRQSEQQARDNGLRSSRWQ